MTASKPPDRPTPGNPEDLHPAPKKRYQKPAFSREQLFETMALACGKATGSGGQCQFVKKNS